MFITAVKSNRRIVTVGQATVSLIYCSGVVIIGRSAIQLCNTGSMQVCRLQAEMHCRVPHKHGTTQYYLLFSRPINS